MEPKHHNTAGIDEAAALATKAHAGQVDKAGRAYILHPMAVAAALSGEPEEVIVAALLHDVVEDGGVTLAFLAEAGFSEPVVSAIDALTRRPGESYNAYLDRVAENPIAAKVKIADAEHNLRRSVAARINMDLPEEKRKEFSRMAFRYEGAITRITTRTRRT